MKKLNRISFDYSAKDLDDLLNQFPPPLRSHSRRVAVCSSIMAEYAKDFCRVYDLQGATNLPLMAHLGGTCHDIGKLALPVLAADQADYLKHPVLGAEFLETHREILFENATYTQVVIDIVRHHHEQPDGGGFPSGLQAKDMPPLAGICAVADALDHQLFMEGTAQMSGALLEAIKSQTGDLFCESAVICLERAWPQLTEQYARWK